MPEDLSSLADLLQRARQACDQATAALYHTFTPYLLRVARRRLPRRLWSKEDPEDIVQNVWKEFFRHLPPPELFKDTEHLKQWLARMTQRRAADVNRRYLKRPTHNVRHECALDEPSLEQAEGILMAGAAERWREDRDDLVELKGRAGQLTEAEGAFTDFLWAGFSLSAIATFFAVSPKTVRRVLGGLARRGGIYETPPAACG
jgi:DNA-directed RNA polymerase specialized sigma24 family protein